MEYSTETNDRIALLISEIQCAADAKAPGRLLVGIAGPPGSGKSTLAEIIVHGITYGAASSTRYKAKGVSLDGFHYARSYLDALPNREEAFRRRGAPWTFDADAILQFTSHLHATAALPDSQRPVILAPSFDHARKDPVIDDIEIRPEASIVILDGNYLLLDEDVWRDISKIIDFKVFVDIDAHRARERVARRHVAAGIEPNLDEGFKRFDENDRINGDVIRTKRLIFDFCLKID